MAPISNTSSLENLNGSAGSVYSNCTYQSISLARTTTAAAGSAHPQHSSNRLRYHTHPAPVAEEYHYRDNSAVGYDTYQANSSFAHPTAIYQEPTGLSGYSANQAQSRSQTCLLPAAPVYNTNTYDRVLTFDDDQVAHAGLVSTQRDPDHSSLEQVSVEHDNHYHPAVTHDSTYLVGEYGNEGDAYYSSPRGTDVSDEDNEYQPSTPPQQRTYGMRPHSPTTQRFLREDSPEERMRLGLPRYETYEQQARAYEAATGYGTRTTRRR